MNHTFADSFYFLALFNPRDAAHERAVRASRDIRGMLVTTDWVLAELADALSDPVNRTGCIALIDDLRGSPRIEIQPASRELFDAGWDLYRQRPDKNWSLTDCISFVVLEDRGITVALTGDHHFEQAGFRVTVHGLEDDYNMLRQHSSETTRNNKRRRRQHTICCVFTGLLSQFSRTP